MRRRDLIKGIAGSAIAWPLAARAQQNEQMRRVGILMGGSNDPLGQGRAAALVQGLGEFNWRVIVHRHAIITLAARYRLPAVYPYRFFTTSGGLMSYGIDPNELFRRAASYVDRILKGAKPADMPVQNPDKFELVINLKTAQALGITVAPSLLTTADEVIE